MYTSRTIEFEIEKNIGFGKSQKFSLLGNKSGVLLELWITWHCRDFAKVIGRRQRLPPAPGVVVDSFANSDLCLLLLSLLCLMHSGKRPMLLNIPCTPEGRWKWFFHWKLLYRPKDIFALSRIHCITYYFAVFFPAYREWVTPKLIINSLQIIFFAGS